MTAKNDRRIQRLSRELSGGSKATADSMETTVADGLPESVVTIVVETPHGRVVSLPISESAADTLKESIETGIERLRQLRLDTEFGSAVIPGNLLRQSLIRFHRGRFKPETHHLDREYEQPLHRATAGGRRKTRGEAS